MAFPSAAQIPGHAQPTPGDLYQQEAILQANPQDVARINAWARQTATRLNWNLPLRAMIQTQSVGPIVRTTEGLTPQQVEAARYFTLRYPFPVASYVTGFNIAIRATALDDFDETVLLPDATYGAANLRFEDYVDFYLVRQNNEIFTAGSDNGYAPASNWMGKWGNVAGSGNFSLIQFLTPGETLVLNGRLAPQVGHTGYVGVTINYLQLPIGTTA